MILLECIFSSGGRSVVFVQQAAINPRPVDDMPFEKSKFETATKYEEEFSKERREVGRAEKESKGVEKGSDMGSGDSGSSLWN